MSSSLLKEGTKHLSGVEGAVIQNLEAVQELSKITRTSLGPNGMNKMVINRHGKLFVTNDAATILKELEILHPAAKMCVLASDQQEAEFGDATNLVLVLCGELLAQAQSLLQMGLHPADVIRGFEKSGDEAQAVLKDIGTETLTDLTDVAQVTRCIKSAIDAKQHGYEDLFSSLVAEACVSVLPEETIKFNVDNVRVTKILGGAVSDAFLLYGAAISRDAEGTIKSIENTKVAVYNHGFDVQKAETKQTVFIDEADDLEKYSQTEEDQMESKIKAIHDAGVGLVVCGGTISEMAMHFFERFKIMVIKSPSKFELRRICQACRATGILSLAPPTAEEMGWIDECKVQELGSTKITVFRSKKTRRVGLATIVLRAATQNVLDDIERAIDDGIHVFKACTKDNRFVPGAGASEIEIARRIKLVGESTAGQDQYSIKKYAEAFEVIPRTLAENAGLNSTLTISSLYAKHEESGGVNFGVNIEGGLFDATAADILDHLVGKGTAIRLATNAAVTILRIGQIIMSKPAGMPMPGGGGGSGTMGSMDQDE